MKCILSRYIQWAVIASSRKRIGDGLPQLVIGVVWVVFGTLYLVGAFSLRLISYGMGI
jgi:hypothetical protein